MKPYMFLRLAAGLTIAAGVWFFAIPVFNSLRRSGSNPSEAERA